ncbi:MBG domain-containing protein [Ruminococcus sp.]|uniref:MBG domain-containing protein n=1 Tax=Ruminococcus sp. TaxID=41978 RepID=UPI0025FF969A|nr:MBG domain-containing protein [Ruminococcus sp.]MBQ8967157.1 hypothetical protein [Ruminococcus sp.]
MARNLSHDLKRLVAGVCAVLVVGGAVPVQPVVDVFRTNIVANADSTEMSESDFVAAIQNASAQSDKTYRLENDISISDSVDLYLSECAGDITIDLNGHTLTVERFRVEDGYIESGNTLTITDNSAEKTGILYGRLNIRSGTVNTAGGTFYDVSNNGGTWNISGGQYGYLSEYSGFTLAEGCGIVFNNEDHIYTVVAADTVNIADGARYKVGDVLKNNTDNDVYIAVYGMANKDKLTLPANSFVYLTGKDYTEDYGWGWLFVIMPSLSNCNVINTGNTDSTLEASEFVVSGSGTSEDPYVFNVVADSQQQTTLEGEGTEENPYIITSFDDLALYNDPDSDYGENGDIYIKLDPPYDEGNNKTGINLPEPEDFVFNKDTVLDLNGSWIEVCETGSGGEHIVVPEGVSLTVNDSSVPEGTDDSYSDSLGSLIHIENSGTLIINKGAIQGLTNTGDVTINGGYFDAPDIDDGTATINGGYFTALNINEENVSDDDVIIKGGTFEDGIDPEYDKYIADGYERTTDDDGNDVVAEATLEGEGTEESPYLITSLDDLKLFNDGDYASGSYLKFDENGTFTIGEDNVELTKGAVIDLNGNTIDVDESASYTGEIIINSQDEITISGGNVEANIESHTKLNIKDCTIDGYLTSKNNGIIKIRGSKIRVNERLFTSDDGEFCIYEGIFKYIPEDRFLADESYDGYDRGIKEIKENGETLYKVCIKAKVSEAPTAAEGIIYDGGYHDLLESLGSASPGVMLYKPSTGDEWYEYSSDFEVCNAGKYTINYKAGTAEWSSDDYIDSEIGSVTATINTRLDLTEVKDLGLELQVNGTDVPDNYVVGIDPAGQCKIMTKGTLTFEGIPEDAVTSGTKNGLKVYTLDLSVLDQPVNEIKVDHDVNYRYTNTENILYRQDLNIINSEPEEVAKLEIVPVDPVEEGKLTYGDQFEPEIVNMVDDIDVAGLAEKLYQNVTDNEGTSDSTVINWTSEKPVNAGNYIVKAELPMDGSTLAFRQSFTIEPKDISKAELKLTGEGLSADNKITYDKNEHEVKVEGTEPKLDNKALVKDTDFVIDTENSTSKATDTGDYTVKVTGQGNYKGSAELNWSIGNIENDISKLKINGTEETTDDTKTYDGQAISVDATAPETLNEGTQITYDYYKIGDNEQVPLNTAPVDAGSYKVVAHIPATKNYLAKDLEGTFKITPKDVTVSLTNKEFTYGDISEYDDLKRNLEPTVVGAVGEDVVEIEIGSLSQEYYSTENRCLKANEEGYTVTASTTNKNYNITSVTGKLVINKKALNVKPIEETIEFGEDFVLDYNIVDDEVAYGDSDDFGDIFTVDYEAGDDVGTYDIEADAEAIEAYNAAANNYTIAVQPKISDIEEGKYQLTVEARRLKDDDVSLNKAAFDFNGSVQQPEVTVKGYNGSVIEAGDKTYSLDIPDSTNAGEYTVTVTGQGNYTGTVTKTYKITSVVPALEIAVNGTITYDGEAVDKTDFNVTNGNTDSEEFTLKFYADNNDAKGAALEAAPKNAGKYWVEVSTAATANFEAASSVAQFEINKANVIITPKMTKVTYGSTDGKTDFDHEYTVTGATAAAEKDGIFNGEDLLDADDAYAADKGVVGRYGYKLVIPTTNEAYNNYNVTLAEDAKFIVDPVDISDEQLVTITVKDDGKFIYTGEEYWIEKDAGLLTLTYAGNVWKEDADGTLTYAIDYAHKSGNKSASNVGTYNTQLRGQNNFVGTAYIDWSIVDNAFADRDYEVDEVTYGDTLDYELVTKDSDPADTAVSYEFFNEAGESIGSEAPVNAGSYTVKATLEAEGYESKTFEAEFTIGQKTLTAQLKDITIDYGAEDPTTAEVENVTGAIEGDEVEVTVKKLKLPELEDGAEHRAVGNYDMTAAVADVEISNPNYKLENDLTGTLSVGKITLTEDMFSIPVSKITAGSTAEITPDIVTELTKDVDYEIDTDKSEDVAEKPGEYKIFLKAKEDGNYTGEVMLTWTVEENAVEAKVDGHSLTLDGPIKLNFYVDMKDYGDKAVTAKFTTKHYDNKKGEVVTEVIENVAPASAGACQYNVGYDEFKFQLEMYAYQMSDNVKLEVYVEGEEEPVIEEEYSIVEYAKTTIDKTKNEDLRKMLINMVEFGTQAQKYFNYNNIESEYADEFLTEAQRAYARENLTDYNEMLADRELITYDAVNAQLEAANIELKYTGSSLIQTSGTKIRHYFKPVDMTVDEALEKYGSTMKMQSGKFTVAKSGSEIYIESASIAAKYVNKANAYGVVIGDATVIGGYQLNDYFKSISEKANPSAKTQILQKMNEAQYYFSENAVNYFK